MKYNAKRILSYNVTLEKDL